MQDYVSMIENVCPVCGKRFLTPIDRVWGWNWKGSTYCSYHCMRHVEIRYRIGRGLQKNTLWQLADLSDGAKAIWDDMLKLRHVTLAGASLQKVGCTKEWRAVEKKRGELLGRYAQAIQALPDRLRYVIDDLCIEGKSTIDVLTTLDCDGDVLKAKLGTAMETMSEWLTRKQAMPIANTKADGSADALR